MNPSPPSAIQDLHLLTQAFSQAGHASGTHQFNGSEPPHTVFSAHIIPEILRNILIGILLRVDELDQVSEGSAADDWLRFVEQKLNYPLRGEDAPDLDGATEKLDAVEKVIAIFASKPWRNGKTLLEEFV